MASVPRAIVESVDAVDRLRRAPYSMSEGSPPAIRDDLLRQHQLGLAMQQSLSYEGGEDYTYRGC